MVNSATNKWVSKVEGRELDMGVIQGITETWIQLAEFLAKLQST